MPQLAVLAVVAAIALILLILFLVQKSKLAKAELQHQQISHLLQDSQQHLQNAEQGVMHLDASGNILFVNKQMARWLNAKPEQLSAKHWQSVLKLAEQSKLVEAFAKTMATRCHIQLDGKTYLAGLRAASDSQQQLAFSLSLDDVSRYQQQIDELTLSQQQLDSMMKASSIAEVQFDVEQNQIEVNQALAELLDEPIEQLNGPAETLLKRIYRQDWSLWSQSVEQAMKMQPVNFECRFTSGMSDLILAHLYLQAITQADGHKKLMIWILPQKALAQTRQQLVKQQTEWLAFSHAQPHATYMLDEQGHLINANNAFEQLFSVTFSQVQDKHLNELSFIPDDIRQQHQSNDLMLMSLSGSAHKEWDFTDKLGNRKTLRFRLQRIKQANGQNGGSVGVFENISELKQAKKEQQQHKQRFYRMLELAPVAMAIVDENDKLVQANPTFTQRLGVNEEQLKKTSFYQLFNDPTQSGKAAKQLQAEGKLRGFAARLKGADGELHPSELHMDMYDEKAGHYLCWIFDISQQQFHQDKFDSLLQHSSMPMAVLKNDGFAQLNPAALDFFAVDDEDELLGKFPHSPELNPNQEAVDKLQAKLQQLQEDGKAQSLVWQHQRGEQALPCQATYVPMFQGDKLDSVLCIWMDMRALAKADEERLEAINLQQAAERQVEKQQQLLASSQDKLASKVRSLSDTENRLKQAQQDLDQKLSTINELQQAHSDVTAHLQQLKQDYNKSRELLAESKQSNAELEQQLAQSSETVGKLQTQRNQIADALQLSQQKYQKTREQLEQSELQGERLQQEREQQQQQLTESASQIAQLKDSILQKDQQMGQVSGQIASLQSQLLSSGQTSERLREQLVNQRKASEQAEIQRRKLEETYRVAQAELSGKARQIDHLQHEMQKFEEMSQQQKGDMQSQQQKLQQELAAKQAQLDETQQRLDSAQQQAEQEKIEKTQQQQRVEQMQKELEEVQQRAEQQQAKVNDADQHWKEQQQALQQELLQKQQQLQQTEKTLNETRQQTEAEKAERARQQQIFDRLQQELQDVEQRSQTQQQKMAESEAQWKQQQQALEQELQQKQQNLQQTQEQLSQTQHQSEQDKLERLQEAQKLEQLKVELADVQNRADKQQQMMQGTDEQWRQHRDEIEQQKQQLQQALQQAQQQNDSMQQKLQQQLSELQDAEQQVQHTRSAENDLQQELEQARNAAQQLQQELTQREQQEQKLQQQLDSQQQVLAQSENNVERLQQQHQQLMAELNQVQEQYRQSQQSLSRQDSSQSQLDEQLKQLEQQLQQSQSQLQDKEQALEQAQQKLASSQDQLKQQEQAWVQAHQQELEQAKQSQGEQQQVILAPEIADLPLPESPEIWFELLPFLQQQTDNAPLAVALSRLLEELQQITEQTDEAVNAENAGQILMQARKLIKMAQTVKSEPLLDLSNQLEAACKQGQVDSISIFWPTMKKSLHNTLRVIYSHLQI
ncbi:PAS domain-containing protein [Neptunicella marina]